MAAVAARYARALVDVVASPKAGVSPDAVRAQLRSFLDVLRESEELRNVLANPAVAAARKRALVERLGQPLGLARISLNFLFVLIDHRRVNLLDDVLDSFESLLDERLGVVRASVTTATQIGDEERRQLEKALGQLTGKQVRMELAVDPQLLGGAVTRIGSTIYDGSVREHLRLLRQLLSE